MSRQSTTLLVASLFATACGLAPTYSGATQDAAFSHETDAAVADRDSADAQLVADGGPPPPPAPTDPGPAKPGTATAPTLGGFTTTSERRSAGDLTVQDDGFETGNTLCADKLCASGGFEP